MVNDTGASSVWSIAAERVRLVRGMLIPEMTLLSINADIPRTPAVPEKVPTASLLVDKCGHGFRMVLKMTV
jgi:hypothetical protein